jgi:hypothetical protein
MVLNRCPFCEQPTAPDAKFCSACGGALHLLPCPSCGAVNDATASACYQCCARLREPETEAPDAVVPAAEVLAPWRPGYPRIGAGAAILAVIGALGYYSYLQHSPGELPPPPAASGAAAGVVPAAGTLRRDAAPEAPARSDAATPQPEPSRASPAPAAASPPRAERKAVESPRAKPAAVPTGSPALAACTEAVAALGLCHRESVEKKEMAASAGGLAPGQEPRDETCTKAVAALGLCTPASTRRRK